MPRHIFGLLTHAVRIDLHQVVTRRIASGKWGINSGQTCLAPDYLIVKRKNAQKLVSVFSYCRNLISL